MGFIMTSAIQGVTNYLPSKENVLNGAKYLKVALAVASIAYIAISAPRVFGISALVGSTTKFAHDYSLIDFKSKVEGETVGAKLDRSVDKGSRVLKVLKDSLTTGLKAGGAFSLLYLGRTAILMGASYLTISKLEEVFPLKGEVKF